MKTVINIPLTVSQVPSLKKAITKLLLHSTFKDMGEDCWLCEVEVEDIKTAFMLGRVYENYELYRLGHNIISFTENETSTD